MSTDEAMQQEWKHIDEDAGASRRISSPACRGNAPNEAIQEIKEAAMIVSVSLFPLLASPACEFAASACIAQVTSAQC